MVNRTGGDLRGSDGGDRKAGSSTLARVGQLDCHVHRFLQHCVHSNHALGQRFVAQDRPGFVLFSSLQKNQQPGKRINQITLRRNINGRLSRSVDTTTCNSNFASLTAYDTSNGKSSTNPQMLKVHLPRSICAVKFSISTKIPFQLGEKFPQVLFTQKSSTTSMLFI